MQRAHGVAQIQAPAQASDTLANVEDMSRDELLAERALLLQQKAQLENEASAQKRAGRVKVGKGIGYRIQTLCTRLSEINTRIKDLNRRERDAAEGALREIVLAMQDYLPPDGITAKAFASRVIGAVDNDQINPIIERIMREQEAKP